MDEGLIPANALSYDILPPTPLDGRPCVHYLGSFEDLPRQKGRLHLAWQRFDDAYLKRLFGGGLHHEEPLRLQQSKSLQNIPRE